jgi:ATP-dependent Zn protease
MPNRETLSNHNRDWWTPVINDFLTLLDAAVAGQREGVVVVGATNNIQAIDPALLRPGRLEKMIEIKRPDLAGAINILRYHLEGELKGDLSEIGAMIEGSTGAEIMYAVRGARRIARHAGRAMTADDIKRSIVPIAELPPDLIFRMSIHEAAHAVVALAIPAGTVRQVVIRSKGGSGGRTTLSFDGADLFTRRDIEDQVVVGLAARVAERHFTGAVSCGGGGADDSDLGVATVLIASLHASFAMGDHLIYLAAGDELLREVRMNPALHACVDQHLRELEGRAEKLVRDNRDAILAVANRLSAQRYLSGAAVREIVEATSASNGPRHKDISDASSEG